MSNPAWTMLSAVKGLRQPSVRAIAIVGAGFSGSMVAAYLLQKATHPLTIYLIDRQPAGRGIAYSTQQDCHLLNVPAAKMSAFADDPDHLLRWVRQNSPDCGGAIAVTPDTFLPRKLYGHYIQATLATAEANAPPQVRLKQLHDEVVAIDLQNQTTILTLAKGGAIATDQIVLALGNFSASPPPVADRSFYRGQRYLGSAWSTVPDVAADEPLLLIGSGLTALDVVLTLHQQKHRGVIHLVSRRGLLPQPHRSTPIEATLIQFPQMPNTIRAIMKQVRLEIASATAEGKDWRSIIDGLRPATQALWQQLPLAERQRFLRHVRPYWDTHRHRVAPAIAQTVTAMIDSGQLLIIAGRIQAYHEDADGVNVVVQKRCGSGAIALRASRVLNCTGANNNYRKIQQPLVQHLLNTGLIQPDALGIGLEVHSNGALIQADGTISDRLYTLGSTRAGKLWETIAVPELRLQSQSLAQELLHRQSSQIAQNARGCHQFQPEF